VRVAEAVDGAALRDAALELRVLALQLGVVAERVAEGDVPREVATSRLDVEVDPKALPVDLVRPDRHRAGRRPRIGPGLWLEPELVQHGDDAGNVRGLGLDREVDDALARQARDRGAADVLDREIRAALGDELGDPLRHLLGPRIPLVDLGRTPLVRSDRLRGRGGLGRRRSVGHGSEV
jgi:hypothetical protein